MSAPLMDDRSRRLILGAEIAGLIHDLGKLRPEFAEEKLEAPVFEDDPEDTSDAGEASQSKSMINSAHGEILESSRSYPPPGEAPWLEKIRHDQHWKSWLRIPDEWVLPRTIQANGLGDPLRQHHASKHFPAEQLSLLGDLFAFGADIRDSALDKSAAGITVSDQRLTAAFFADSFGNERVAFSTELLRQQWQAGAQVINRLLNLAGTEDITRVRSAFISDIEPVFRQALGATARPTNDVTLWHHSYATASLFKAAVAEAVLRRSFKHLQDEQGLFDLSLMGRIRFRLLGIRWDWAALSRGILQPVALTALAAQRREAVANLRRRVEAHYPVGNVVYEDDGGVVLAVPGFYHTDTDGLSSEELFRTLLLDPLQADLLKDLAPLGAGATLRFAWTKPRLYLTDYAEVMPCVLSGDSDERQRLLQVGETELRALWNRQTGEGEQVQICPQCGLRPGQARELGLTESTLRGDDERVPDSFCGHCQAMVDGNSRGQRRREARQFFGVEPRDFELQAIRQQRNPDNARVVLLSVRVSPENLAGGDGLLTQLARPLSFLKYDHAQRMKSPADLGDYFQEILADLREGELRRKSKANQESEIARQLIGDPFWLNKKDGRFEGSQAEKARHVVDAFFLREPVPQDLGLHRHDGDRLALFAQRKHPSPGRLARLWDDLRALWKQILWDIAGDTEGWLLPLSLDPAGFRVIVAASDARAALSRINRQIDATLGKVRAGIDVHVSALAFREKFPLYIALDALQRLESRAAGTVRQEWTLKYRHLTDCLELIWSTPQGEVTWRVNMATGDPEQPDIWYPHAVCVSRPRGPGRLVRLDQLEAGETISVRPSTFDFAVLEGTTRRYSLRYDQNGCRPHFILGEAGRPAYLLEQMEDLLNLARRVGWNPSQSKAIIGRLVECYERWVRDVPDELRETGRAAWLTHARAILGRAPGMDRTLQEQLLELLPNGTLFDAFEWAEFIEKRAHDLVKTDNSKSTNRELS